MCRRRALHLQFCKHHETHELQPQVHSGAHQLLISLVHGRHDCQANVQPCILLFQRGQGQVSARRSLVLLVLLAQPPQLLSCYICVQAWLVPSQLQQHLLHALRGPPVGVQLPGECSLQPFSAHEATQIGASRPPLAYPHIPAWLAAAATASTCPQCLTCACCAVPCSPNRHQCHRQRQTSPIVSDADTCNFQTYRLR
jgi:hypothetical protein